MHLRLIDLYRQIHHTFCPLHQWIQYSTNLINLLESSHNPLIHDKF